MKITDYPIATPEQCAENQFPALAAAHRAVKDVCDTVVELQRRLNNQTKANDWQADQLKAARKLQDQYADDAVNIAKERDSLLKSCDNYNGALLRLEKERDEARAQRDAQTERFSHQLATVDRQLAATTKELDIHHKLRTEYLEERECLKKEIESVYAANNRQAKMITEMQAFGNQIVMAAELVKAKECAERADAKLKAIFDAIRN